MPPRHTRGRRAWIRHAFLIVTCLCAPALGETGPSIPSLTVSVPEWGFRFALPSQDWTHVETTEGSEPYRHKILLYKRRAIRDPTGRPIEPALGLVFSTIPDSVDVVLLEATSRQKNMKIVRHLDAEPIRLKAWVGWLGTIQSGEITHKVKVVTAKNGTTALRVMMDATAEVFPRVEAEFDSTLASLRFISPR